MTFPHTRLPIVQGGTFTFLAPTFAILSLPHNLCPADFDSNGWGNMSYGDKTEEWQKRMREVQGAIVVASVLQVVIGYFGIIGALLKYISPLTIAPSVAMIGLSLFKSAARNAALNWGLSLGTMAVMIAFSQYMKDLPVPFITYAKGKGFSLRKFYIIRLFPVLMTIFVMWILSAILTATDVFVEGDPGRTDVNIELIKSVDWFRFPYPCLYAKHAYPICHTMGPFSSMGMADCNHCWSCWNAGRRTCISDRIYWRLLCMCQTFWCTSTTDSCHKSRHWH